MWRQRTILVLLIGSLTGVAIPLLVYQQVHLTPTLKDAERAVADFRPATLAVPRKAWQPLTLTAPVSAPLPAATLTPASAPPLAAASGPAVPVAAAALPTVSFILHDGGKDMAIVNNNVLKAGDRFQEWRVERIERNRVLLSSRKGPLWITLQ